MNNPYAAKAPNPSALGVSYNCVAGCGLPPDQTSRGRIAIAVPQTT
jgi:hypothetical protein